MWHLFTKDKWQIRPSVIGGMLLESLVWCLPLLVIGTETGSEDGFQTLTSVDLRTGGETSWEVHRVGIAAAVYSADHRWFASGGRDTAIALWSLREEGAPRILRSHGRALSALAFSPDGRRLMSAAWDETLRVHDVETASLLLTVRGFPWPVEGICFTPDGHRFAVWGGNVLRVFDARELEGR